MFFCRRVTVLTRSVQVAVVLSFSSISFPILCTVTWVCLMALWAVWSLQEEEKHKVITLIVVCYQTPDHKNNPMLKLSFQAATELTGWIKIERQCYDYTISFSLDVYSDCLEDIIRIMTVPIWKCFFFLFLPLFYFIYWSWSSFFQPHCQISKTVKWNDELS